MSTPTRKKKTRTADDERFDEIEKLVTTPSNRDRFQTAKTAAEIRTIAEEIGIDTGRQSKDFGKMVYKLKIINVDFKELLKQERAEAIAALDARVQELAQRAGEMPIVRLWSGAVIDPNDETSGSYAVVDATNTGIQYGRIPEWSKIFKAGDVVSAEQHAADAAVYTAFKAREAAGEDEVCLWLYTTCPDLDTGKLKRSGARMSVAVDIIVDEDETAVYRASDTDYRYLPRVSEEELAGLVEYDVEADEDGTEEPDTDTADVLDESTDDGVEHADEDVPDTDDTADGEDSAWDAEGQE